MRGKRHWSAPRNLNDFDEVIQQKIDIGKAYVKEVLNRSPINALIRT